MLHLADPLLQHRVLELELFVLGHPRLAFLQAQARESGHVATARRARSRGRHLGPLVERASRRLLLLSQRLQLIAD